MIRSINEIKKSVLSINRSIIAMLVLTLSFTACEEYSEPLFTSKATMRDKVLTFNSSTSKGRTVGDPNYRWHLQVVSGKEFCRPKETSGSVRQPFYIEFDENSGDEARKATIRITYDEDGYTKDFTLTQLAKTANPDYDRPWAEQPGYKGVEPLIYKTYYVKDNSDDRIRNYSICYDPEKLVSHWVAYPVHNSYLGSSGRTNAWSYDDASTMPVIPQTQQWSAGVTYSGYARGHILPSATRLLNYTTNAQTFYSTNIMPQHYNFNGGVWASLEGKVRSWSCNDTLFVVTGTLFKDKKTITKSGRTTWVPTHCYKVVLRTRSGNTGKHLLEVGSASELKSIGFIFENNDTGAATSITDAAVSVKEIEELSGFTFFRNLNPEIADAVKSQRSLRDWGM